jgi:AcrR family transcriptional regulator
MEGVIEIQSTRMRLCCLGNKEAKMSYSPATTKVDPRVKRTRKLLQQAFQELMTERGFQDISVQDITDRAEINRATFYAHFEDKYDLLRASVSDALEQQLRGVLPERPQFTVENIRLLALTVSAFMSRFFSHCGMNSQNSEQMLVGMQVQQDVHDRLAEWIAHTPTARLVPDEAAHAVAWVIFGTAIQQNRTKDKAAPDAALALLVTGIAPYLAEEAMTQPAKSRR